MATYDFTWKVVDFDANTHICTVTYTPKNKKLKEITTNFRLSDTDDLENTITDFAPTYEWHIQKNKIDANTVLGLSGTGSKDY